MGQTLLRPLLILLEANLLIMLIPLHPFRHGLAFELPLRDEVGRRGAGACDEGDGLGVDACRHGCWIYSVSCVVGSEGESEDFLCS